MNKVKQMLMAVKAVIGMHEDSIKLLEKFDKEMPGFVSLFGDAVTLDLGSSLSKRKYVAESLVRLYVHSTHANEMLGVNICFENGDGPDFTEPVLVIARITYAPGITDQKELLDRGKDPWHAFHDWAPERKYMKRIALVRPPKRPSIVEAIVAAIPLFSVHTIEQAKDLISLVGKPEKLAYYPRIYQREDQC